MRGLDSLGVPSALNHGKANVLAVKNLLILSRTGRRFPLYFQFNDKLEEGSICHGADGGACEPRWKNLRATSAGRAGLSPSCESHSGGIMAVGACTRNSERETKNL